MATLVKKKIKNKYYYYLVEVKRVNGKPKYTNQVYLGPAEKLADRLKAATEIPEPLYSQVLDFGDVTALYDLSQRLGVSELLNECIPKRNQGISVGEYALVAAINRAVAPTSKIKICDWFSKTVLSKVLQIEPKLLTSQRFWDNMDLFDEAGMEAFEERLVKKIVNDYNLSTSCLIYDATNFFTYIDTKNDGELAKRGHSKEKRTDLKIIGLSMMVSPDHNIPLFYEVYPGNKPDAVQFKQIIQKLKKRYEQITGKQADVTLVFDRGNNSEDNVDLLYQGDVSFNFVGGLKLNQCKELLEISEDNYIKLEGSEFGKASVIRTKKMVFGKEMTVLMVYNPELYEGQMQGIEHNIQKCLEKLNALEVQLKNRADELVTKGKKPTVESVTKNIKTILSTEYMGDIFDIEIFETKGTPEISYKVNYIKLKHVQKTWLGKTVLFTDRHDWSNEKIVSSYRSAWHVEYAFRQMKNTDHLSVRPMWHWTDQKVKVHIFFCILAYRLCCLLNRELEAKGIFLSINEMLSKLSEIKQVINFYDVQKGKEKMTYSLTKGDDVANKLTEHLNLLKYKLVR